MSDLTYRETPVREVARHQSAETVISIALLSVCATAGLASWGLAKFGGEDVVYRDLDSIYQKRLNVADLLAAEEAVLDDWRQRLDAQLNQREQVMRQQQQSAVMEAQAAALVAARAAADAATRAAAEAEARARLAERERRQAVAEARSKSEPVASVPLAKSETQAVPEVVPPVDAGEVIAASVDWSSCKKPVYPLASVRLRQEGVVTMSFAISAEGEVENGSIIDSSGTRRLDNTALNALSRCHFFPETIGGVARPSTAQLRFAWRLTD